MGAEHWSGSASDGLRSDSQAVDHRTREIPVAEHLLYRYATRMLLERVSWLCRDHRKEGVGNGKAEIIFSNRGQMSYDDLRDYIHGLKVESDPMSVTIDWSVINADMIRPVEHSQLAGLQIADAVASSLFAACNPNRYGDTEDKYLKYIAPTMYRHRGALLGYGMNSGPETRRPEIAKPALGGF